MSSEIAAPLALEPLVISAPFGNYIRPTGATATVGTFTAEKRSGRIAQILKTVRYSRSLRAWVNRIGLRNPGIDWYRDRCIRGREKPSKVLVSVHGFDPSDWKKLLERCAQIEPLGIELNISCPNVGELTWPPSLFTDAVGTGHPVCVKLPPIRYEAVFEAAFKAGVRVFHCTNTLPVPQGGLSGMPLKPVSLEVIRDLRARCGDAFTIIGGGGIYHANDIDDYADAGANRFAIGTKLFHVRYLFSYGGIQDIRQRANTRATDAPGMLPAMHEAAPGTGAAQQA